MDHWLCPGVGTPGKIESGKSSVFEPEQNFDRKKISIRTAVVGKRLTNQNFNNTHHMHNLAKPRFLSCVIALHCLIFL